MLPAERREVGEEPVRNLLDLPQCGHGAIEIARVPQDDRGDQEVQARSSVLLVLVGAVADLAEAMDEDRARQAIARFPFVEFLAGLAAQFSIFQPVEGKQRPFQPPQLAQRGGEAVLPRIGGELPQDQKRSRCRYGSRRRPAGSPANGRGSGRC